MRSTIRFSGLIVCFLWLSPVEDVTCRDPAGFDAWLAGFKREAAASGISPSAIGALDGVAYEPGIVKKDHGQGVFQQSFEQFAGRMVPPRLRKGQALIKQYAATFAQIEETYGVPAPVIVAIWGLETDFGAVNGDTPTLPALATLAYDCRRTDKFQAELLDALRIVQRGDLSPGAMRGAWAGELGQTQFMPSSYLKFAVGRRDLIHSTPDALASTANYLSAYGWQRGGAWTPGSANFAVIKEWNKADVYAQTIAYFATRLAGGE